MAPWGCCAGTNRMYTKPTIPRAQVERNTAQITTSAVQRSPIWISIMACILTYMYSVPMTHDDILITTTVELCQHVQNSCVQHMSFEYHVDMS